MTLYADDRPHPVKGMIANPEWQVSLTRRAELYIAERERRQAPEREPARFHIALGIIGGFLVVLSLFVGVVG